MCVCTHVCVHVCVHVHACVCMCVCACVHACVCWGGKREFSEMYFDLASRCEVNNYRSLEWK